MVKIKSRYDKETLILPYIISKHFSGDYAQQVYNEVAGRAERDFKNTPVFNYYFRFKKGEFSNHFDFNKIEKKITGSNIYYGILVNETVKKDGFWIPTSVEAQKLAVNNQLSFGVYRDYGICVYTDEEPNSIIARALIKEAMKRGWQLPILAPFKSLRLLPKSAQIMFNDDSEDIMTGKEASQYMDRELDGKGRSGVCRLNRCYDGGWWGWASEVDRGSLAYSTPGGRIDFICHKATRKN